jgi:hypothetical protein
MANVRRLDVPQNSSGAKAKTKNTELSTKYVFQSIPAQLFPIPFKVAFHFTLTVATEFFAHR